jgi:prolyl-tRNA editing enzyme YbaK/EbsC (Cys-tRNA(Pro) deacylase)
MRSSVEVNNYLQSTDAKYELVALSGHVKDAEQMAELLGLELPEVVKALVFIADGAPLLAIIPGDRRANKAKIKVAAGVKKLDFAPEKNVMEITDFQSRATPPVAWKTPPTVLIDSSVSKVGVVYAAGGEPNIVLKIRSADLIRITEAAVADIT